MHISKLSIPWVLAASALGFLGWLGIDSAHANPPDLCAEPVRNATGDAYVDAKGQTISRFCQPLANPPILDAEVCCTIGAKASCAPPDDVGRCNSGMKFWCEHGEVQAGHATCYQDGPDSCEAGFCHPGAYAGQGTTFDDSSWVCCSDDNECVYVGESGAEPPEDATCEHGTLTICSWGATNEDGTVDCLG